MREMPKGQVCQNCEQRPATTAFSKHGSALDFNHGFYDWWCERCILVASLEYAAEQADRIPELRRRLLELDSPNPGDGTEPHKQQSAVTSPGEQG